jgi:hypothetical protein
LIPIFALILLIKGGQESAGARQKIQYAAIFLAFSTLPLLAWAARNRAVHAQFTLSTTLGITLTQYVVADTLADAQNITREQARQQIPNFSEGLSFNLDVIRRYPLSFAKISGKGIFRTIMGTEVGTWVGVAFGQTYKGSGLVDALLSFDLTAFRDAVGAFLVSSKDFSLGLLQLWGIAYTLALFFLGAMGSVRAFRAGHGWLVIPLVVSAFVLMILPLSAGEARFRVPVEPYLALLCGFFSKFSLLNEAQA